MARPSKVDVNSLVPGVAPPKENYPEHRAKRRALYHGRKTRTPEEKARAIEIACFRLAPTSLKVLEDALMDNTLEMKTRIMAAKEVLDRALGRPKMNTTATVSIEGGEALIDALGKARIRAGIECVPLVV